MPPQANAPLTAPRRSNGKTWSVLVVDDSAAQRFLTRLDLAHDRRFTVVGEASDGRDAIARAAGLQPDVVLLDVEMPGMDGPTAFPGIRVACPSAWVIVFSLLDPSEAMELFPSPRPVGALAKSLMLGLPGELATIISRLEEPASRKRAAATHRSRLHPIPTRSAWHSRHASLPLNGVPDPATTRRRSHPSV